MSPEMTPTCSVIIPSYERPRDVLRLLSSLRIQVKVSQDEIIIVDDGSSQTNLDLLLRGVQNLGLPNIVFISDKHGGVSQARNTGIEASANQLLIFLDQDCFAATNYIEIIRTTAHTAEAIQGNYLTQEIFSDLDRQHMLWRKIVSEAKRSSSPRNFGVNTRSFAIWKTVLLDTCGKNPFVTEPCNNPGGEDIQFGMKLFDMGVVITLADNAVVCHTGDPHDLKGLMKQKFSHGKADALTGVLAPDTFAYGNFARAVLLPIRQGVSFSVAFPLWAAYTSGAAFGLNIINN